MGGGPVVAADMSAVGLWGLVESTVNRTRVLRPSSMCSLADDRDGPSCS